VADKPLPPVLTCRSSSIPDLDLSDEIDEMDAISVPEEKVSRETVRCNTERPTLDVPLADQEAYRQAKKRLEEMERELHPPRPIGRPPGSKTKAQNHFLKPPVRLKKGERTPKGFQNDPERGLVPVASQVKGGLKQNDVPFDRFFDHIGTKKSLAPLEDALARSKNVNAVKFLAMLAEPRYGRWRLSTIAKKCGLTLTDMGDIWRNSQIQRSMMEIVNGSPLVAADMVEDARSIQVCCPRCDGLKRVDGLNGRKISCPNCGGEGVIRKPGDHDSRTKIFETIGLTGKGRGININNFNGPVSVDRELDELDNLMDDKTVIDVGVADVGAG